jgi:branched-subunit amino acid transport protein
MMELTLTIIGMSVITVAIKALIFILGDRVAFSPWLRKALEFVPVTVLTAIIVPMVLAPHGKDMEISWHNAQLIGALVAIAVCLVTRHQLLTIIAGLAAVFAWQLF